MQRQLVAVQDYMGIILIAAGIVMTFFGAKFAPKIAAFVIGLLVTAFVFSFGYNFVSQEKTKP